MTIADEFGKKAQDASKASVNLEPKRGGHEEIDSVDLEAARQKILRQHYAPALDQEKRLGLNKKQLDQRAFPLARQIARARIEAMEHSTRKDNPHQSKQSEEEKHLKFSEWEAKKREALQTQQLNAKRELDRSQAHQRDVLDKQHRLHSESRQADAARLVALEERQRKGSFLSRGIDKLRGIDLERDNLQKNIDGADRRIKESQNGIDRQDAIKADLGHNQEQETQKLEMQIEQAKAAGYEIPKEKPPREILRGREREERER